MWYTFELKVSISKKSKFRLEHLPNKAKGFEPKTPLKWLQRDNELGKTLLSLKGGRWFISDEFEMGGNSHGVSFGFQRLDSKL